MNPLAVLSILAVGLFVVLYALMQAMWVLNELASAL